MNTTTTTTTNEIKLALLNKIKLNYKHIKTNLNNLNQFQKGVLSALVSLLSIQIVYSLFQTQTSLIHVGFSLIQLFMTMFSVFSFYTWLTLIYGRYWSDTGVYILFVTFSLSELIIQLIINNNNNFIISNQLRFTNIIHLTAKKAQYIFIFVFCTIFTYLFNIVMTKLQIILFVFAICVTRLYVSVYLFNIIPLSVNAYLTYVCALSGFLFSHFITKLVNELNSNKMIRIEINPDMNSNNNNNNKFKSNNFNNNNPKIKRKINSVDAFKRRISLPTIPLKTDKVRFFFYSFFINFYIII
jgi:hypothetical protein